MQNDENEEQNEEEIEQVNSPQLSPAHSPEQPSSASSQAPSTSGTTPIRMRNLNDVYESCNSCLFEPENFEETTKKKEWRTAMQDEIIVIVKNKTWDLVDRPKDKTVIGVKWIYKTKLNQDGSIQRNKARLVSK